MILTCPSCSAQYFADDKAIGEAGRTVRCAACAHSWFVRPELSLEEEINASDLSREKVERMRKASIPAEPTAPHLAYREKELSKKRNGSRMAVIAAWGGTAAVFFALGIAAILQRDDVVRVFPQASSAYAMAGLEVNRFGLEFADVTADRIFDGTTPVLTVSGTIVNVSKRTQMVPNVRIDLRNDAGADVESALIAPEATSLAPGEQLTFNSRLDSPSLEAYDLAVTFVEIDPNAIRLAAPGEARHDPAPAVAHDDHAPPEEHHAPADGEHHPEDDHASELAETGTPPHDPETHEEPPHDEHG